MTVLMIVCRHCEHGRCGWCAGPPCECKHPNGRSKKRKPNIPDPDDKDESIHTISGGLPTLGKKR